MQLSAGVVHPLPFPTAHNAGARMRRLLFEWEFHANTPAVTPLPHSFLSLSLSLSSCRQQVQILARKCAARWRKKKFSTHPRRISHCLAISVIISREKQNVLQVASWMLLSACCLLHVAGCPLPIACCLAALLTRAWPIMRRAPSGEIDEDAQMQTHSANGQYGAADGVLCTICGPDNYGQNSQLATGGLAALLLLPAIHAPGLA